MSHKLFRWFFVLILIIGLAAIPAPQAVRAAGPWYVTTAGDDNNDCLSPTTPCATINGAIGKATDGDTINVAIGTYTSTATNGAGVVWINQNITLTLLGGWDENFTIQNGMSTIDGQEARGGIDSISDGGLTLDHFTIQNGNNGGIVIQSAGSSLATLILSNSVVANNFNDYGGGIEITYGTVTLNNSTVTKNVASTSGGGISIYGGAVTLNNSSVSGNTAQSQGGGIYYNYLNTSLDVNNSSIVNNQSNQGGGFYRYLNSGNVTFRNSILANNTAPTDSDCTGTIDTSNNNIIGNSSGCTISASLDDQLDVNPLLSAYPIGAPGYHTLLAGSPAIDAGDPATCLSTDQRGLTRPQGSACDIGAYEYTTSGTAASFGISAGSNQRFPPGIPLPIPFVVYILDDLGSPASGTTVTFTAPDSGPSGTFADSGTNTTTAMSDSSGLAIAAVFTANNQAGNFTVNSTAADLPGSVIFTLSDSNDNFISATVIDSLPFSDSVDNTQASNELNEQQWCYNSPNTVWYSFIAITDGALKVDMAGTSFSDTILNIYQDTGSGISGLNWIKCTTDFGSSGYTTFSVQAGVTYYLQVGSYNGGSGDLHFNLQEIPVPQNDSFASAKVIPSPLPFDDTVDTQSASVETGEPTPYCAYYGSAYRSLWYAFTPTTSGAVSASIPSAAFTPVFAVYTGDSLANLSQVNCQYYSGNLLTVNMNAGTTYYFQVGNLYPWEQGGSMQFHLDVAPPPQAGFSFSPYSPSAYDTIQFYDQSYDPAQLGFQSFSWDFGDEATSTDTYPTHKYASDGDYTVEHSVTTTDGRTASTSQVVQVRTHDVTVTSVEAPDSAKVGKSEKINVSVLNTSAYDESVTVQLYRSVSGGGFEWVGQLTKSVPITKKDNKPTKFTFNYTFTADDAAIGKVIFRADATIDNANDAFPQDNTRLSSLTIVKKK